MANKIRIGVLSVAKIGTVKVIPAMQKCAQVEVAAIASRDLGRARSAATRAWVFRRPTDPTKNSWPIHGSTRFTIHCRITCMFRGRFAPRKLANMCCARNPSA